MIEYLPDPIMLQDLEGNYRIVNEAVSNYLGIPKKDLIGKSEPDFMENEVEAGKIEKKKKEVIKEERPVEYHISPTMNGENYHFKTIRVPYYNEQGDISGTIGICNDITDLKEVEKELLESEKEKSLILNSMHELVTHMDLNHNIIWSNKAVADDLEIDNLEEIKGEKCYELWHDRDERCEQCPTPKVIEKKETFTGEVTTPENRTWLITQSPVFDSEGNIKSIIETANEITERKEAEKKLEKSKKRFENVIDKAPFPMMLHAEDGEVIKVNKVWTEITGYTKKEIPTISDWTKKAYGKQKKEKEKIIENISKKKGETFTGEFKIKTKKGEEKIWNFESKNIGELPDGRNLIISMAQDITQKKHTQERKDFLNTLLRQDLGNKYITIQGYLQLLEETELSEEQNKYLQKSIKAGKKVDEILGLAKKLDQVERKDKIGKRNLIKEIKTVLNSISGLTNRKKVKIEEKFTDKTSKVLGDHSLNTLLTQILVTRIQIGESKKIKINTEQKEEKITLKIIDNGKKLPKDIKELFTGKIYTGETTGVGGVRYYMIKEIANHNKAKIEVKDSELGGAKFRINLKKA